MELKYNLKNANHTDLCGFLDFWISARRYRFTGDSLCRFARRALVALSGLTFHPLEGEKRWRAGFVKRRNCPGLGNHPGADKRRPPGVSVFFRREAMHCSRHKGSNELLNLVSHQQFSCMVLRVECAGRVRAGFAQP
jgi:hypothetical protein